MDKVKNSIVAKIIAFLVVQVCVVTMVLSVIVIYFNAGYGWYSADYKEARADIMQEIAVSVENDIHDRLYYNLVYSVETEGIWSEYIEKDYDLPDGIGYNLKLLKDIKKNIGAIKLEKNVSLADKEGVYSQELSNDLYELTVYIADPVEFALPASELYPEELAVKYKFYDWMYSYNKAVIVCFAAALVALVLLFAYLILSMRTEKSFRGFLRKIPVDMACCAAVCLSGFAVVVSTDISVDYGGYDLAVLCVAAVTFLISAAITSFVLFLIYRVKCGRWWDNTVIYFAAKYSIKLFKNIMLYMKKATGWIWGKMKKAVVAFDSVIRKLPLVWKVIAVTVVIMALNLAVTVNFYWSDAAQFFWFAGAVIISAAVIYIALCMKRLQKGGQKLAEGDLDYKIDNRGLLADFADHAENLNKISDGMAAAVEGRIKSERFKAELITNVSHDIKTPLTSIINYVDLLSKEDIEDLKIKEYIEVLERQSKRLKKLTEDLVDASKASTGNVRMEMAPCKIGLLMSQTMGEYKTKGEDNGLEFILKVPEEELEIFADGRRLWRVFDNLLNNICKYSQPGTRVYLTLEEENGKAVITYRNISKYELDISEKELMERFVRGDKSRHTEGSGLGLSIARNLVELQGGSFDISIDGDLFKVVIEFDLLNL